MNKSTRLRFKKPIQVEQGRVQFMVEAKLGKQIVGARYTLPKAEVLSDENGRRYLQIEEGPIVAKPNNIGVGSKFLRQTHGIFREISRRTQMDLLHVTTPANNDSRRFFETKNGYMPYKAAESARLFRYRGGKPRERSENVEKIMWHLMGDKLYWESRRNIRRKK